MSVTTVYTLFKDREPEILAQFSDAWGSAPVIWQQLWNEYFPEHVDEAHLWMTPENLQRIYSLIGNHYVPGYVKAVLLMTMETGLISREYFDRAALDIQKYIELFPPQEGDVNHWSEIASLLEKNPEEEWIGIHHSSETKNPFMGKYNESGMYQIPDLTGFFNLYEFLDQKVAA